MKMPNKLIDAQELIGSVYLGDRACTGISIDSWESKIHIRTDSVLIKKKYEELKEIPELDVPNGQLVLENVTYFSMEPKGFIPNDYINELNVTYESLSDLLIFNLSISSVNEKGLSTEVILEIHADNISICDQNNQRIK